MFYYLLFGGVALKKKKKIRGRNTKKVENQLGRQQKSYTFKSIIRMFSMTMTKIESYEIKLWEIIQKNMNRGIQSIHIRIKKDWKYLDSTSSYMIYLSVSNSLFSIPVFFVLYTHTTVHR